MYVIMESVISGFAGLVIGILFFLIIYFGIYRNTAVLKMKQRANHAAHNYLMTFLESLKDDSELNTRRNEWETMNKMADDMRNRNGYDRMVLSFRPLTIENWYTDEECEIIKNYGYEN